MSWGENLRVVSTPHPLHPNCESGPNYFPPNLFFFRARQAQNFATAIAASASRCQLHYIGRWPCQGCQGCGNGPKCGPKCGPKLDPIVWTQFSPIGIRTDGLQPNLGPQGIVARFRTTFGSTFWVHILGPRVRVHSTRLAPHIQCQRGELNQKKNKRKIKPFGRKLGR